MRQYVSAPDEGFVQERVRIHAWREGGRQGDRRGAASRARKGRPRQQRNSSNALPSGWGLSKGDGEEETAFRVALG